MHFLLYVIPLVSVTSTLAAPIPIRASARATTDNVVGSIEKRIPSTWHHHPRHPVNALFKRGSTTISAPASESTITVDDGSDGSLGAGSLDSTTTTGSVSSTGSSSTSSSTVDTYRYPAVGTTAWAAGFPTGAGTPDPNSMPQEWIDALNAAVAAGSIPNIPKSVNAADMTAPGAVPNIKYPSSANPKGSTICSSSFGCKAQGSLYDAPNGYWGIAFENGPTAASDALLNFLSANEVPATHFMIGVNILQYPKEFQTTFSNGDDIAVNTWSHPAMTTLSNEEIVSEIGWSMQLIHNSTGGRVPRFWRPPYGDVDNRVIAIAHAVFGLRTVLYNTDTEDWQIDAGIKTAAQVDSDLQTVIDGSQSPGIIPLDHETTSDAVQAFIRAYPKIVAKGWKTLPVSQLFQGLTPYQNVNGNQVMAHSIIYTDSDDNLSSPVGPSEKVQQEDNGSISSMVIWSKSSLTQLIFVSMVIMFAL